MMPGFVPGPNSRHPVPPPSVPPVPTGPPNHWPTPAEAGNVLHESSRPPQTSSGGWTIARNGSKALQIVKPPVLTSYAPAIERSHSAVTSSDGLDRFAEVYVPAWLRAVNLAPPSTVLVPNLARAQDLHFYAGQVFPKNLLDDFEREDQAAEYRPTVNAAGGLKPTKLAVSGETAYASKFITLQLQEHAARKANLASSAIYEAVLEPFDQQEDGRPCPPDLYRLSAPSIREGWPPLAINDIVILRQLRPEIQSWQGIEFVAKVFAVQRVAGLVVVACEPLKAYRESMLFNVQFKPQDRSFIAAHKALSTLNKAIEGSHTGTTPHLASTWLFPDVGHDQHRLESPTPSKFSLINPALNAEQELAVRSIVFHRRKVPFLISGPPGTGKTMTIVETVLQILCAYPDAHCLVCGASNSSSNTLATHLSRSLDPMQLFRLCDESRPLNEVPMGLMPYCRIENERFVLPSLAELLKYRVIVTSVLDASVLCAARITNTHLARLEERTLLVLRPDSYHPTSYHFDYLLVDEAAQASEPEISSALAVVLPDNALQEEHTQRRLPQIVLCGDDKQLGPFILSEVARNCELDLSLLARLFERPLYKNHPRARHVGAQLDGKKSLLPSYAASSRTTAASRFEGDYFNDDDDEDEKSDSTPATSTGSHADDGLSQPFVNLVRNYRSHVGLLMLPSSLFYSDTLEPCAGGGVQETPLLKWERLMGAEIPFLLCHTAGQEEQIDEGTSWYNDIEAARIVEVVQSLVSSPSSAPLPAHGRVLARDISIISPFREQVWRIRLALRKLYLGEVNVGSESDMQGAENRIVLISTVRSSVRFVSDDRRRNRGLLHEPKRFNVATTRAKELLVVVGDVRVLYTDPYWRAYIRLAIRRKGYEGPSLVELGLVKLGEEEEGGTGLISRLEERYVQARQGGTEEERQEMLGASVARLAMDGNDE